MKFTLWEIRGDNLTLVAGPDTYQAMLDEKNRLSESGANLEIFGLARPTPSPRHVEFKNTDGKLIAILGSAVIMVRDDGQTRFVSCAGGYAYRTTMPYDELMLAVKQTTEAESIMKSAAAVGTFAWDLSGNTMKKRIFG